MTRNDGNHTVAQYVKKLEERVTNLEEQDRTTSTPNLLRTQRDRVIASDADTTVTPIELTAGEWDNVDTTGGWGTSTWGSRL